MKQAACFESSRDGTNDEHAKTDQEQAAAWFKDGLLRPSLRRDRW